MDVEVVWAVIEHLACQPPASEVANLLAVTPDTLATLDRATAWLHELTVELRAATPAPRRVAFG